jgi:hypothetical protein
MTEAARSQGRQGHDVEMPRLVRSTRLSRMALAAAPTSVTHVIGRPHRWKRDALADAPKLPIDITEAF